MMQSRKIESDKFQTKWEIKKHHPLVGDGIF